MAWVEKRIEKSKKNNTSQYDLAYLDNLGFNVEISCIKLKIWVLKDFTTRFCGTRIFKTAMNVIMFFVQKNCRS